MSAPSIGTRPQDQWVPTPKHILRKACIHSFTRTLPAGRFIEIGAGNGQQTIDLLERGHVGACYDIGEDTRVVLAEKLAPYGDRARVVEDLDALASLSFEYLVAFEVLEHIEDDAAALRRWSRLLRPGGACIVSVPAHQRKFGPDDVAVGHVRRYEKAQLVSLFADLGYTDIQVRNYGFPLGNLTRWVGNCLRSLELAGTATPMERSIRSGIDRPSTTRMVSWLFNSVILSPFVLLQCIFFSRDWGDGYVLVARKQGDAEDGA